MKIFKKQLNKNDIVYIVIVLIVMISIMITFKFVFSPVKNDNVIVSNQSGSVSSQNIYEWRIQNQPFTKKPDIDFSKLTTQDE